MAINTNIELNLSGINAAIIMDGNGRWAKGNALNITSGHEKGLEVVRSIVELAVKVNLESLSLYAFSTENWSRPKKEILGIKKLIIKAIKAQVPELIQQKVSLNFFGDFRSFGQEVIEAIDGAEQDTTLGYGGRADILQATQLIAEQVSDNTLLIEDISDDTIFDYLQAPIKELDLLIRTGGDHRISNFLLYHMAYTEIQFSKTLWPDFNDIEFEACLKGFLKTERRFGKRTI